MIEEFNVDSEAEYSALSSTRSQKKKLKQTFDVAYVLHMQRCLLNKMVVLVQSTIFDRRNDNIESELCICL